MTRVFFPTAQIAGLASVIAVVVSFSDVVAQEQLGRKWYGRPISVPATQVVDSDYFAMGPLVEISGTVNGDLYALGGQILIDGRVNGDVIAVGGRISISGSVSQDVRVVGGQVSLTGNIGRNVSVAGGNVAVIGSAVVRGSFVGAGGNIHIASPIGRGVRVAGGSLIISDRVGGNVYAVVGALRISSRAQIQGNVRYISHQEASVDEGARIQGQIMRTGPPTIPQPSPGKVAALLAAGGLFAMAVSLVSTLVLGLLSLRFLPKYHGAVVGVLREKRWASLGIGFVGAVVTPVICAILFATVFGVPLGMILTVVFFILLYWGRIFAMTWIGEGIFGLFRATPGQGWNFILGLVAYYLVALIPIIGWLAVLLAVLFGLGAELIARKDFYVTARKQGMI